MNRVIYCPDQGSLDKANKISLFTKLPVQIGDSIKTKNLTFDRSVVSIILVPNVIHLDFNQNVKKNIATRIQIYDEWHSYCNKNCYIKIEYNDMVYVENPLFTEINSAVFIIRFKKIGINNFFIFNEDILIASGFVNVTESVFDEE